jgi:neuronal growth regulator 1
MHKINFQFKNISKNDAGIYECQISINLESTIGKTVEVQVRMPPTITDKTSSITTVSEGATAQMICNAEGYPRPVISWKRESNEILPAGGLETT